MPRKYAAHYKNIQTVAGWRILRIEIFGCRKIRGSIELIFNIAVASKQKIEVLFWSRNVSSKRERLQSFNHLDTKKVAFQCVMPAKDSEFIAY